MYISAVRLKLRDNWAFNTDRVLILFTEIDFFCRNLGGNKQNMTGFFEELPDSNIDSMEIKIRGLQNKLKKLLPTGIN